MAKRISLTETNQPLNRTPEVAIKEGDFVQFGTAGLEPLEPENKVAGISMETVTSADANFDSTDPIQVDIQMNQEDLFEALVVGSLASLSVGDVVDVSTTDASKVEVPGGGDTPSQFEIVLINSAEGTVTVRKNIV